MARTRKALALCCLAAGAATTFWLALDGEGLFVAGVAWIVWVGLAMWLAS